MSETTQATLAGAAAKTYETRAYAASGAGSGLAPATIRRRAPRPQTPADVLRQAGLPTGLFDQEKILVSTEELFALYREPFSLAMAQLAYEGDEGPEIAYRIERLGK
jgi:hypothetical protein